MRASWLTMAATLLLACPVLAQTPEEPVPPDPVEVLDSTLKAPSRNPRAREAELAAGIARLQSLDQLRRALELREWRDQAIDDPLAAVDRAQRAIVVARFAAVARGILHRGALADRLDMLRFVAGLEGRGIGDEPLARLFTDDIIALTHPNPPALREAATRTLGQVAAEPGPVVTALADLLKDADPALRTTAAESLRQLVIRAGRAVSADEQTTAAAACRAVVLAAVVGLRDDSALVRCRCAEVVGRSATTLAAFLPPLDVPPDPEAAAQVARQIDTEITALRPLITVLQEQITSLARATGDSDARVRVLARHALEDIAEARLRLLRRASVVVALNGVPGLAEAQSRAVVLLRDDPLRQALVQALPAIVQGLDDPDVRTRRATVDVLETLGRAAQSAVTPLVRALSDRDRFVRWAAARALGKVRPLDPEQAVPHLARLLSDADPNLRVAAAAALREYGPGARSALPDLLEASRTGDGELRLAVVRTLEGIGSADATALAVLNAALNDNDARVRRLANEVLGKVGPSSREAANALLRDPPTKNTKAVGAARMP